MAKKRKKQKHRHPAKKDVAHRWPHDPDIPLRQKLRGAMGDVRVMGDRDSAIRLTNSIKALDEQVLKLLRSRKFEDKARAARLVVGVERENNRIRLKDADIAIACIDAHGAEMAEQYKQMLTQASKATSPEDYSAIVKQGLAEAKIGEG